MKWGESTRGTADKKRKKQKLKARNKDERKMRIKTRKAAQQVAADDKQGQKTRGQQKTWTAQL